MYVHMSVCMYKRSDLNVLTIIELLDGYGNHNRTAAVQCIRGL